MVRANIIHTNRAGILFQGWHFEYNVREVLLEKSELRQRDSIMRMNYF